MNDAIPKHISPAPREYAQQAGHRGEMGPDRPNLALKTPRSWSDMTSTGSHREDYTATR